MSERIVKAEIDATEKYVSTDEVLHGAIEFDPVAYFDNDISPTVLAPSKISGYEERSLSIMIERLNEINEIANLPRAIYFQIVKEIEYEHKMRCEKNTERMARLQQILADYNEIPAEIASVIKKEFNGTASTFERAFLVSVFPQLEGSEVMKATFPLDRAAMNGADTHYKKEMLKESFNYPDCLRLRSDNGLKDAKEIDVDGNINTSRIKVVKSVEAIITLNDVEMELVGRRSYVNLPGEFHSLDKRAKGGEMLTWYPIASSKYLRLKRAQADSTEQQ